ncbi:MULTISPECIES: hypothetical protein [Serratia]|uniref:Uncharacterized protein n=1 Tax=Serratia quinivorans TaxID=137545 RepID=A0A379YGD4_9GAMM|nr:MULTISPECIES: hypothetical protein [Serratia]RYM66275.1 hypothetical protein BSR03_01510 [Serratia proteamaculans]CAI1829629.1 Uncharacterised protein [Serratia quinivorans]SUI44215.1 Uncharacterised protein [Serratia quinivorans]
MSENDEFINDENEPLVEELVKILHVYDDGCDWTAWLSWKMNSQRRLSQKQFELPPARPQVMKPALKPKKKCDAAKHGIKTKGKGLNKTQRGREKRLLEPVSVKRGLD